MLTTETPYCRHCGEANTSSRVDDDGSHLPGQCPGRIVTVTTPQGRVLSGTVRAIHAGTEVITSKGTTRETLLEVEWSDGDVTLERPQDMR